MKQPNQNSSAGRLWHLVNDMKAFGSLRIEKGITEYLKARSKHLAGHSETGLSTPPSDVYRVMSDWIGLIDETASDVRALPATPGLEPNTMLYWTSPCQSNLLHCFSQSRGVDLRVALEPFNDGVMHMIATCSFHLEVLGERVPPETSEKLSELFELALALFKEIADSGLDPDVRRYLEQMVTRLIDAILDFRRDGVKSLLLAHMAAEIDYRYGVGVSSKARDSAKATSAWTKVIHLYVLLHAIVSHIQVGEYALDKFTMIAGQLAGAPDLDNSDEQQE